MTDSIEPVVYDYSDLVGKLRATFRSHKTKDLAWRKQQLEQMRLMFTENWDEWTDALRKDLGRSKAMCVFGDLSGALKHIGSCITNLKQWNAPRKVSPQMELMGASAMRKVEPKGVILNIAPWNFPVCLLAENAAYMIAAGNCVVLKPSEISTNVEQAFAKFVPKYLDQDAIQVVTGGIPCSTALLKEKWDHIMYTGNGTVGRIVMAAAAKHLTPVTLELGGKSPCIVDESADIKLTAKRLVSCKTFNCGQICVAPDYVLVHKSKEEELYTEIANVVKEFYPEGQAKSTDYARIINEHHWRRLGGLLEEHGGEIVSGGVEEAKMEEKYFPLTVVKNPNVESRLMTQEIFGPILPIMTFEKLEDVTEMVASRDHPLALYIFSSNQASIDYVLDRCTSGGACINDCVFHLVCDGLPFGGVGASGMGTSHGKEGFEQFCHLRSVLHRGKLDMLAQMRYPPYTEASFVTNSKTAQATTTFGKLKAAMLS